MRTILTIVVAGFLLTGLTMTVAGENSAPSDLVNRVDSLIAARAKDQPLAPPASDAEFLRRVYLDFDGGIPSSDTARKFFTDSSPGKRAKLVDCLIAGPRFSERLAEAFNIMLMERRPEEKTWREYLQASFKANKPWDQLAREILNPDFKNEKLRGAGHFVTQRLTKVGQQDTDYPGLTRDVGRLFLGLDLKCGQCHRHLTVSDYKQVEFNGLFMAYQNLKVQAPAGDYKTKWVSESLMTKKYEFVSVFTEKKRETAPRVPFGKEIQIPEFSKDEQWTVAPDRKKRILGTPRFSPIKEIANHLATKDNPQFALNIANRVWFIVIGRGLVEPLDLHHSENPPSHPELLNLLATELVNHQFDIKWLIRELALTQTYQRSSLLPDAKTVPAENLFASAHERPISWEQLFRSFLQATGEYSRIVDGKGKTDENDGKKYSKAEFEKAFAAAFANAATEPEYEVSPSLRAALFLRNNDLVLWSLRTRPGNLVHRLAAITDNSKLADELYLSTLTRFPDSDERATVQKYLTANTKDRSRAIGHLAWSLVSSIEFFVNH